MNSRYEIIIYSSNADSAYIAEVPDLPGCMADSISYQDARSSAQTIIAQWLETEASVGRVIPRHANDCCLLKCMQFDQLLNGVFS